MGKQTGISWTQHTFNAWWGCTKVSPGCDHCYAERLAVRANVQWGARAPRRYFSDTHWDEPLRWNAQAQKAGRRALVFTNSMADVFDAEIPREHLERLFALIRSTPHLIWQLLTKRHARIEKCLPTDWGQQGYPNVWLGVSVENQQWADTRIPALLEVPAVVRFVSAEPLLGQIDLSRWIGEMDCLACGLRFFGYTCPGCGRKYGEDLEIGFAEYSPVQHATLDWVIVGGESGPKARSMLGDWARDLQHQCAAGAVPFFFKQWGDRSPERANGVHHGGDLLDGRQYHEFPDMPDAPAQADAETAGAVAVQS